MLHGCPKNLFGSISALFSANKNKKNASVHHGVFHILQFEGGAKSNSSAVFMLSLLTPGAMSPCNQFPLFD